MTGKLFVLVVIVASLALGACKPKNPMTGPTPTTCEDTKANNLGGPLPCTYLPPKEVELPGTPLWSQLGAVVVKVPVFGYPGKIEARISLNEVGTYPMRLLLATPPPPDGTNTAISWVVVPVTLNGTISLPHDGITEIRAWIQNTGPVVVIGTVKIYYIRD